MDEIGGSADRGTTWSDWLHRRSVALVLAAAYLLFGLVWILFSDYAGQALFTDPGTLTAFQTWKGGAFVLLSAGVVYLALALRRVRRPDFATTHLPLALEPARRGRWPVVVQLSLLVLATGLPMVALLGFHVARETRSQIRTAEALVRDVAENTASDAVVFLQAQLRIAVALAQRGGVRALDPAACDPLLPEVAGIHDVILEISTFRADGRMVCGRADRLRHPPAAWAAELRRTRAPVFSPLERDGLAGIWRFAVVQPIIREDGELLGAVELTLPATALVSIVEAPLPEGGAVAIVDQRLQRAARFPVLSDYIGTPVTDPPFLQAVRSGLSGSTHATVTGPDGVRRLAGLTPVGRTGWFVAAGVPVDSIYAPARLAFLRSLQLGQPLQHLVEARRHRGQLGRAAL
ncbi:MAG: hypothetical protein EOO24_14010, partial [Comamonadaceae bacterium]